MGSRDAIAQAKGEIFAGLGPDGVAVVNMHDRYGTYWRDLVKDRRAMTFGIAPEDDVVGKRCEHRRLNQTGHSAGDTCFQGDRFTWFRGAEDLRPADRGEAEVLKRGNLRITLRYGAGKLRGGFQEEHTRQ